MTLDKSTVPSTTPTPSQNTMVGERNAGAQRSTAVSPAKVKANRQNALRSTGPRTQRGKQIASENALKHGFFCKELLIRAGDGRESAEEFESLFRDLVTELRPNGCLEYMLVERIAASLWRLRRIARYETAEIRKRADNASIELLFDRKEQFDELASELRTGAHGFSSTAEQARRKLVRTTAGVNYIISVLQDSRAAVGEYGYLSEKLETRLFKYVEHDEVIEWCSSAARKAHGSQLTTETKPGQNKEDLLRWLDEQLRRHRAFLEVLEHRDKSEAAVHVESKLVPQADTADKIMHYEDHLLRHLYKALDELERMQRARAGKHVPPPPMLAYATR